MPTTLQIRTALVSSCTMVKDGGFLCILDLEGSPKGRISVRARHALMPGSRVKVQGSGMLWAIVSKA
jgi:hypothetical protein